MDYLYEKLTENIKSHDNIIIMTHRHPDLDGMGSAIALSKVVAAFKKDCYIVFPKDKINVSLKKGLSALENNNIIINFKTYPEVVKLISANTLLIILDTQKPTLVENQELLEQIKDIFVIDHHINCSDHISDTIFQYINSNKSSIAEIMAGYLNFLNQKINPVIITLLAAGMEIDTNSYSLKTTEDTFKAADILMQLGTDPILKSEILKESKDDAIRRYDYIKKSYFIKEGYLLCDMGDDDINDKVDIAILADELLRFDTVQVSFAVGKIRENIVGVSTRSIGKVSADVLMRELGGGGHVTDAAAEFTDKTTAEVVEMIKEVVMEG